jgi:RimJ/RimL family protein N-acetyltransferase
MSQISLNFILFMNILLTTERLILRELTEADAENIYQVKSELVKSGALPSISNIRDHWLPDILAYYQERVVATALANNTASIRVMEKVGLRFEKWIDFDNSQTKAVQYFLLKDMFDTLSS